MNVRIGFGLLVLGLACGEVTAEPISAASFAITSVEIDAAESSDPYACEVAAVDASNHEASPFVRLGELAYAGTCKNPGAGSLGGCWYTGDTDCEGLACGGFAGGPIGGSGEYELAGGQHMLCPYSCVRDEDCPAAATGTARPACLHGPEFDPATETGQCMLGCGSGEVCPDGFVCIHPGLAFGASDGSSVPAPAQCVQFHQLTLRGTSIAP